MKQGHEGITPESDPAEMTASSRHFGHPLDDLQSHGRTWLMLGVHGEAS